MITPAELEAIEARANAATEGPWVIGREVRGSGDNTIGLDSGISHGALLPVLPVASTGFPFIEGPEQCEANARFIAVARSDVPALIAEVRRLQAEVAKWKAAWTRVLDKYEPLQEDE